MRSQLAARCTEKGEYANRGQARSAGRHSYRVAHSVKKVSEPGRC
jgi:hypothetical protein